MRLERYITEVTESPLEDVIKMLRRYKNPMTKALKTSEDIEELAKKLSDIFDREKIVFMPFEYDIRDAQESYVASATTIPSTGEVRIQILGHEDPTAASLGLVDKNMDVRVFFGQLVDVISHEFIHRKQFKKFKPEDLPEFGDIVSYICCHLETEAWAHMGYYNLSKGITSVVEDVIDNIKDNKKCYNRFLKKLYYYCKNDKEAMENLNKLLGVKGGKR